MLREVGVGLAGVRHSTTISGQSDTGAMADVSSSALGR
jgi:hypothetical protein